MKVFVIAIINENNTIYLSKAFYEATASVHQDYYNWSESLRDIILESLECRLAYVLLTLVYCRKS